MSKITKEFLDDLIATQEKLANMYELLEMHFDSTMRWEQENIGKSNYDYIRGTIQEVEINKDKVHIETLENDDGYYHHNYYSCPSHKLLSDDWKEAALKEYEEKQEAIRKEKEKEEERKALEKERKEREEYERLKAKFEG